MDILLYVVQKNMFSYMMCQSSVNNHSTALDQWSTVNTTVSIVSSYWFPADTLDELWLIKSSTHVNDQSSVKAARHFWEN